MGFASSINWPSGPANNRFPIFIRRLRANDRSGEDSYARANDSIDRLERVRAGQEECRPHDGFWLGSRCRRPVVFALALRLCHVVTSKGTFVPPAREYSLIKCPTDLGLFTFRSTPLPPSFEPSQAGGTDALFHAKSRLAG